METESVASSPRSSDPHDRLRFMCSYGGKIVPRPHDNQLRYVSGDTRIVAVSRSTSFSSLLSKLSKLTGTSPTNLVVKYQLPNEDLDALISVTTDEDLENMIDEYDRLAHGSTNPNSTRLRLFLFPKPEASSPNRDHWFIDALNSGANLDRNRSEVSSIVSEVPDYLFGLDNAEESQPKPNKTRNFFHENFSASDPGSPAPVVTPQFSSIPNLPPVKTKPIETHQGVADVAGSILPSPVLQYYPGGQPVPVYYMPQPYVYPQPVQGPVGFPQAVYGGGGLRAAAAMDMSSPRVLQMPEHHVVYGVRGGGFPGMVFQSSAGEIGSDGKVLHSGGVGL